MAEGTKGKLCCLKLSKKQKFKIFHTLDSILLLLVQLGQAIILNYFIVSHANEHHWVYGLYALDALCSLAFITTLYLSYKYLYFYISHTEDQANNYALSPKKLLRKYPTTKLGVLPMSYVSWVLYVGVLLVKIFVIFCVDLFAILHDRGTFGPHALKMTIGLSSLIFLLLVEAHNRLELNSERYNYVTSVCSKVGVEIFDSVSLLSVLLLGDEIPVSFGVSVCCLAGLNFLLPALSLYRLSLPDKLMVEYKEKYPLQLLHHLLRTTFIEVPFLTVRLFMWISYEEEASMFMMKNIFNILVTLRTIHPELVQYLNRDDTRPAGGAVTQRDDVDAPPILDIPHFEDKTLKRKRCAVSDSTSPEDILLSGGDTGHA